MERTQRSSLGEVQLGEAEWRAEGQGEAGEPGELGAHSGSPQRQSVPQKLGPAEVLQGEQSQGGMGGSCSPHRRDGWRGEKQAGGEAEGGSPERDQGVAEEAERTRRFHWSKGAEEGGKWGGSIGCVAKTWETLQQ
ncbi:unnamed protein product [Closterium sp. Naga37s-1]|nr:unnamed protein product [Closterium sp. Naga37s-1]